MQGISDFRLLLSLVDSVSHIVLGFMVPPLLTWIAIEIHLSRNIS